MGTFWYIDVIYHQPDMILSVCPKMRYTHKWSLKIWILIIDQWTWVPDKPIVSPSPARFEQESSLPTAKDRSCRFTTGNGKFTATSCPVTICFKSELIGGSTERRGLAEPSLRDSGVALHRFPMSWALSHHVRMGQAQFENTMHSWSNWWFYTCMCIIYLYCIITLN